MGLFDAIKHGLEEHQQHKEHLQQFTKLLMDSTAGGSLSSEQELHIRDAFTALRLTPEDLDRLRLPAYRKALESVMAKDKLSEQDLVQLAQIQAFLKVPDAQIAEGTRELTQVVLSNFARTGGVSEVARSQVDAMLMRLKVSKSQLQDLGLPAYRKAVAHWTQQGTITREQLADLKRWQDLLEIPDDLVVDEHQEIDHIYLLSEIQQGHLPTVSDGDLVKKKGELIHLKIRASLLEEKVVDKHWEGGSHGVSVRLAKGLSYRVGSSRGHLVSTTAVVPVSNGSLMVTNQRVVFRGDAKSLNFLLGHVLDVHMFSDGVRITDDKGKPHTLKIADSSKSDLLGAILQRVLHQSAA